MTSYLVYSTVAL